MNELPPELARLVRAHRIVHRPDPQLRPRVLEAVEQDRRRQGARRWIGGALVGATIGIAAILAMRCTLVPSPNLQPVQSELDPHEAAYEHQDASPRSSAKPRPAGESKPVQRSPELIDPDPPSRPSLRRPRRQPEAASDAGERPPPSAADPEREVRLLRQAEVVLREDPAAALAILDRHEREFPTTTLAVEREALTVLALCGAGRRIEGRGRRAAFSRSHASSGYAARVSAACED